MAEVALMEEHIGSPPPREEREPTAKEVMAAVQEVLSAVKGPRFADFTVKAAAENAAQIPGEGESSLRRPVQGGAAREVEPVTKPAVETNPRKPLYRSLETWIVGAVALVTSIWEAADRYLADPNVQATFDGLELQGDTSDLQRLGLLGAAAVMFWARQRAKAEMARRSEAAP